MSPGPRGPGASSPGTLDGSGMNVRGDVRPEGGTDVPRRSSRVWGLKFSGARARLTGEHHPGGARPEGCPHWERSQGRDPCPATRIRLDSTPPCPAAHPCPFRPRTPDTTAQAAGGWLSRLALNPRTYTWLKEAQPTSSPPKTLLHDKSTF